MYSASYIAVEVLCFWFKWIRNSSFVLQQVLYWNNRREQARCVLFRGTFVCTHRASHLSNSVLCLVLQPNVMPDSIIYSDRAPLSLPVFPSTGRASSIFQSTNWGTRAPREPHVSLEQGAAPSLAFHFGVQGATWSGERSSAASQCEPGCSFWKLIYQGF